MRAVRLYGPGDLRVEEVADLGPPAPGHVRLAVTAAGICGSDLHNYRTGQWISRTPSTPGHELAGTVRALGDGVEGVSPGDTVVADSRVWCGQCPACRTGQRHLCATLGFVGEVCDGGFAGEVELPARLLFKVPGDLDPAVAAMAEPLAVALHTRARLNAPPFAPVLVVGCGPIGGLCALLLAQDHSGPVLVADRNAARAARVAEVTGARVVELTPASLDAALDGGRPLAAIEATGSPAALGALLPLVKAGGRLALVGIYHGTLPLDPNLLVEREIDLVGCHAFTDELATAVACLPALAEDLARLIDRQIGIEEVPEAYERLLRGEAQGLKTQGLKTIVRPNGVTT